MSDDLVSFSQFGRETNGSEVAEAFAAQIKGKIVCITGVSPRSLGEKLATNIARHSPAALILASRTQSKLQAVAGLIKSESLAVVEPKLVVLDLASLQAVRAAAAEITELVGHIDILINNAGLTSSERRETIDGFEQTLGANHLGHFMLTSLLTPLLLAGPGPARVVNVSSDGYRWSPFRFHDYNFEGKEVPPEEMGPTELLPPHLAVSKDRPYGPFPAYAQSKTAGILHCVALNERLGSEGLKAFAVHPGMIWTDLSRDMTGDDFEFIEGVAAKDWITQDQGTSTILVAALDPRLSRADGASQVFMADCRISDVEGFASDRGIAERLWQLSERLVGKGSELEDRDRL